MSKFTINIQNLPVYSVVNWVYTYFITIPLLTILSKDTKQFIKAFGERLLKKVPNQFLVNLVIGDGI